MNAFLWPIMSLNDICMEQNYCFYVLEHSYHIVFYSFSSFTLLSSPSQPTLPLCSPFYQISLNFFSCICTPILKFPCLCLGLMWLFHHQFFPMRIYMCISDFLRSQPKKKMLVPCEEKFNLNERNIQNTKKKPSVSRE